MRTIMLPEHALQNWIFILIDTTYKQKTELICEFFTSLTVVI